MKHYIKPQLHINVFDLPITTTENILSVPDYIYANEVVNKVGFVDYMAKQATSTKVQNVLQFK